MEAAGGSLRVDPALEEILTQEVRALLRALPPEGRAAQGLARVADALRQGEVPENALPALEQVLTLGLGTGRLLELHGRAAQTMALGLYAKTPAGRARVRQAEAVSAALTAALEGAVLKAVTLSAEGPSGHRLLLETDRGDVQLRLDRLGIQVENLVVSL